MSDKRQRLLAIVERSPARCLHRDGPIQTVQCCSRHWNAFIFELCGVEKIWKVPVLKTVGSK